MFKNGAKVTREAVRAFMEGRMFNRANRRVSTFALELYGHQIMEKSIEYGISISDGGYGLTRTTLAHLNQIPGLSAYTIRYKVQLTYQPTGASEIKLLKGWNGKLFSLDKWNYVENILENKSLEDTLREEALAERERKERHRESRERAYQEVLPREESLQFELFTF